MPPSKLQIWLLACRPKTLTAAIGPVLMGTAMAFGDGIHHFPTALWCLAGALSVQIGTNLANDYFDFKHGVDTPERLGPVRVTQAGLLKPGEILAGGIFFFGLCAYIAYHLIQRGGTPITIIAVTAILSGILYTAGPKPLGYLGLGDIFVFIFFGPVAVAGTYYAQSLEINPAVILAGISPGLFSVAILCINNLRDMDTDRKTGKNTLAVRFGKSFAQTEYLFCIIAAALAPVFLFMFMNDHMSILFSSLTCLMAIPAFKAVLDQPEGQALNEVLAFTGKLLLIFSILFSVGWVL